MNDQAENIQTLDASMDGHWLITTQGSTHEWHIDHGHVKYRRNRGDASASFTDDGAYVQLTRIDRLPTVGSTTFIWYDDANNPWQEQWRRSSTIKTIQRLQDSNTTEKAEA